MKQSDLYREYARVIDLCEGTSVQPWECVRWNGTPFNEVPLFCDPPKRYTFALTVVENRPVFAGDVLYGENGISWDVTPSLVQAYFFGGLSWNPPKPKTFTLNGKEFPLPDGGQFELYIAGGNPKNFYYSDPKVRNVVEAAIIDLLSGNAA